MTSVMFPACDPTDQIEPIHDLLVLEGVMPWGHEFIEGIEEIGIWDTVEQVGVEPGYSADWVNHTVLVSAELTDPRFAPFEEALHGVVGKCLGIYHRFNNYMACAVDQGYRMHRYGEGHFLSEHCDQKRYPEVTHPHTIRKLTMVMYLNDDYEGGDIFFRRRNLSIKPKAGSVLLYPANFCWPHESRVITKGLKYSIATWLF